MTESAPSPFIAGTTLQYAWDSTSLGYFRTCQRYYYYSMIENWRSRSSSAHLIFGGVFASALELYHKLRAAGETHDEGLDGALGHVLSETWMDNGSGVFGEWVSDHNTKNRYNLIRSVIWYLEEYENDPATTVILANGKPAVELSFRFEIDLDAPNGQPYMLSGHLDRVVDFMGERYVMDQKTSGSTISNYYFRQYSPHIQMSLYTLASKVVFDTNVAGVIIDAAQIAVGFTSFARGLTMRTKGQVSEYLDNTKSWLKAAEYSAERANEIQDPALLLNAYPMNETACGNYGGCPFRGVCSSEPRMRPALLATDFVKKVWNPLQER